MQILVYLVAVVASLPMIEAAIVRGPTVKDSPLKFKDCGSKLGKISSVEVSGCDNFPCHLKKGTNVTVTMVFTPEDTITEAVTRVYGYLQDIHTSIPFPVPDDNACHFMSCPDPKGTSVTYSMDLNVKTYYPAIEVIVQWELHNNTKDGTMITCFQVQAEIDSATIIP